MKPVDAPLWAGLAATGNPDRSILPNPTESPDSRRLLGPLWNPSGLSLQGDCRLYCGDRWRTGAIAATGETFALVSTSAGMVRCCDRRLLQTKEEAVLFKRETAAFRRAVRKRQEGGQNNG